MLFAPADRPASSEEGRARAGVNLFLLGFRHDVVRKSYSFRLAGLANRDDALFCFGVLFAHFLLALF